MTRRETLLTLMSALLTAASSAAAGGSDPTLAAIGQPIRDGEAAAGVMLGEPEAAVMRTLGRRPDRRYDYYRKEEWRLDLWEVAPADREWIVVLDFVYLLGGTGVAAVRGAAMRRGAGPAPYSGRTQRGYGLFDGAARLRQLYGEPDAAFTFGPGDPSYLWYRRAGLVVRPEFQADYRVAHFVVLPRDLAAIEARRLVLAQ